MTLTMTQIQNEQTRTAEFRYDALGPDLRGLTEYNIKDSSNLIRDRSILTFIPRRHLFMWWFAYREDKLDGLLPNWTNLTETNWTKLWRSANCSAT